MTFIELEQLLAPHMPTKGERTLFPPEHPNLLFWFNMSEQFMLLIRDLQRAKRIIPHPTSFLVYAFDGGLPNLPIAKGARKYKSPHWLPTVFNAPKKKPGR